MTLSAGTLWCSDVRSWGAHIVQKTKTLLTADNLSGQLLEAISTRR